MNWAGSRRSSRSPQSSGVWTASLRTSHSTFSWGRRRAPRRWAGGAERSGGRPRPPVVALELQEDRLDPDADPVGQDAGVALAPNRVLEPGQDRHGVLHHPGLGLDVVEGPAGQRPFEHVDDERDGLGLQGGERLGGAFALGQGEVGRVLALGKHEDRDVERIPLVELEGPFGGPGAGLVGVEGQHQPIGEPGQEPEVVLAEGRPARGHHRLDAGLVQGDHVGVPLDHAGPTGPGHVGLGPVQVIEQRSLVVDGRVGRVHVLRRRRAAGVALERSRPPNPTALPDRSWIGNITRPRNRSRTFPAASLVTRPASTSSSGRERLGQSPQQEVGVGRRVADGEPLDARGGDPRAQVRAGLGRLPALESIRVEQRAASAFARCMAWRRPATAVGGALALVAERDAGLLCQALDSLGEGQVLDPLHEPEDVAALPASEAVVDLLGGADRERRRLLRVERADARVASRGRPS